MNESVLVGEAPMPDLGSSSPMAGCVLGDLIQRTAYPSALLAWVREALRPGGALILTVSTKPRPGANELFFPGESLAALLFHAGFERPRFYRRGAEMTVTAYRASGDEPWRRRQRLSVILPVFNERGTFTKTMELLLAKEIPGMDVEVVIVESNSSDGTREEAIRYEGHPNIKLILEDRPRGKGHAVRSGLQVATGDFVLIQDADLEYDIDDYEKLLEPLRHAELGFVLGMRTTSDGSWGLRRFRHKKPNRSFGQHTAMSHVMNVGHVVFLTLFNTVYRQRLRDPFTMYKVFRRDCLEGLTFECDRFDFDWELTAKLIRAGYHPREIPVSYHSRSFAEGKKVRLFRDPLGWIRACFRFRFSKLYSYT